MKIFNKKNNIIIIILVFILIITGIAFYPLINVDKFIINQENTSFIVKSNGQEIKFTQKDDSFEKFTADFYSQYKFVNTKLDPFNPVISLVKEDKINNKNIQIVIYTLKRIGINNFDIDKYVVANLYTKPFPEAIAIAQKYDLSKENPDPENIRVQTPPTKAEVETKKKRQAISDTPEFQKYDMECFYLPGEVNPNSEKIEAESHYRYKKPECEELLTKAKNPEKYEELKEYLDKNPNSDLKYNICGEDIFPPKKWCSSGEKF